MTCRLLGQQRIALPSQEFITLRLSVLRVGQGAKGRYNLIDFAAYGTR